MNSKAIFFKLWAATQFVSHELNLGDDGHLLLMKEDRKYQSALHIVDKLLFYETPVMYTYIEPHLYVCLYGIAM